LTEGDSAATMVRTGMSVVGRKKTGCFPLRGKILNVLGASTRQISANVEIQAVLKILGLSFSRKYDNAVDASTLRYGKVCILADQDSDGFHVSVGARKAPSSRRANADVFENTDRRPISVLSSPLLACSGGPRVLVQICYAAR